MQHGFQCACGRVRGSVESPPRAVRGICYCRDCQAYARLTGQENDTLDADGGTEVVATQAPCVIFRAGKELLRCHSLDAGGLLRWYASCCGTPIANTLRNPRLPYVGLVHRCLGTARSRETAFGPVTMRLNIASALRPVDAMRWRKFTSLLRFVPALLLARLTGASRRSAFFDAHGQPVAVPEVLVNAPPAARRYPAGG